MTNNYNIQEKIPIILNWLGCEGLKFIQLPNDEDKNAKQGQDYSKLQVTNSNNKIMR